MNAISKSPQTPASGLDDLAPPNYWRNLASRLRASASAQMDNLPKGGDALSNALHSVRTNREDALFLDFLFEISKRREAKIK